VPYCEQKSPVKVPYIYCGSALRVAQRSCQVARGDSDETSSCGQAKQACGNGSPPTINKTNASGQDTHRISLLFFSLSSSPTLSAHQAQVLKWQTQYAELDKTLKDAHALEVERDALAAKVGLGFRV